MRTALALVLALGTVGVTRSAEIPFWEEFALAKDRTEVLKKLIPGTEEYYYYHALHYLNTEQFEKAVALFKPWYDRFNQTASLTQIQTRHALLTFEKNPQASLDYLKRHLGLTFNHQKIVQGGSPNLPTTLDPNLIARATLTEKALEAWRRGHDGFEDRSIDRLLTEKTDPSLRRFFLSRLKRPDLENLAKIVDAELRHHDSSGFGEFEIHRLLTLAQMEELLALNAGLINNVNFVNAWLAKLQPSDDDNWQHNPTLMKNYLDRLLAFTRKLPPVFNSLKAHVLFQRLTFDQTLGVYDAALFVEYLKLPRFQDYMSQKMLELEIERTHRVDLSAHYTPMTHLPVIGADKDLVRSYLKHFLLTATSTKEYEPYINSTYLKHLFAETKIEHGLGEPETWASLLPPEQFRALKERIDIDFAFTNKTDFGADEVVKLDLFVKNVPTLMVKVFEVNTKNFYRTQQREIDTAINLDGLVANSEQTLTYTETPFRRMPRKFDFPQLTKPGVYVVDFIGAGKSSRALIRKGRLRPIVTQGTTGHRLTVVNDNHAAVPAATVWLGGQEYKTDDQGVVVLPYSTNPGRRPIVITKGDLSSLDFLHHQAENYVLAAGIHVDRESLLAQRIAAVVVRPGLRLNGIPISVKLLQDAKLSLVAVDQDGIASSTEVPSFKLFEDRESVHDFRIPARLASLTVTLQAKVKSLSLSKDIDLAASQTFHVNAITKTDKIEDLHLAKFGDQFVLELLGRTGEAKPDRPVPFAFKHREFKDKVSVLLKSNGNGRIDLGPLTDIEYLTATGPEGTSKTWYLPKVEHTYRQLVHAKAGDLITLPYQGAATTPTRLELALLETRGGHIYADRFEAISLKDGMIEMRGLGAGDYDLWLKNSGERIKIRIAEGITQSGYVMGRLRHLQLPGLKPVQIVSVTQDAENIVIKVRDFSKFTRLHVYGTRYLPAFGAYGNLSRVHDAELRGMQPLHAESIYLSGRNIGDEYRYVLDRRLQRKYPGNMLERPAVLLNPWVLRNTETGEQLAGDGDDYKKLIKEGGGNVLPPPAKPEPAPNGPTANDFANLDYLYEAATTVLNLVPDQDGIIKVSRKTLSSHALVHILAIDPLNTTSRTISLPEQKTDFVDLRLHKPYDPKQHFAQLKQADVLPGNKSFVLADAAASRFEVYDSLAKVYGLYATLSRDPKLAEFSFLLTWPTLKADEKQRFYSKHACHELSFFLAKKDPAFFQTVVKPYLANKKDKTFMDRYLLDHDLRDYMQPWAHGRLNTVERVLLAQRIGGEIPHTTRHLLDLVRLFPPNKDRELMLFESALKSNDLGHEEGLKKGLDDLKNKENRPLDPKPAAPVIPTPTPAPERPAMGVPPGGSGFGGGAPGLQPPGSFPQGGPKGGKNEPRLDEAKKESRDGRTSKGDVKDLDKLEGKAGEGKFGDDIYFENDRKEADKTPSRLYRRIDPTQELAENNYYKLPIEEQLAGLVNPSQFWLDYAKHDGKGPFLSSHLADASHNFTEMMLALSILDLPFTPAKYEVKFNAGQMTYASPSTVLVFHEEVKPVTDVNEKVQILVSQNFYRHGDRYRDEAGERFDKFVVDEFVIHTVYGCQIVVTNPTPSKQRLTVLTQIPVGAIPVAGGHQTRSISLDLEPYRTHILDYQFYFPRAGQYAQFPVHVTKAEKLVAAAAPFNFNVVDQPTKLDTESWHYVSQNGSAEQVLAMMDRENLLTLDLNKIAFRMRDRDFYAKALKLIQERHHFNTTLWSYGIQHQDAPTIREYLAQVDRIVNECSGPLVSPIFVLDTVARHRYQHLEYKPLINARAHALGNVRQIVNDRFSNQYSNYTRLLTFRPQLTDDDKLAIVYYMLLQDRIAEAVDFFAQVDRSKIATQMQYDYCSAYLDFFSDDYKKARTVAMKYANHPVERWRNTFGAIVSQLDEIEGKGPQLVDKNDPAQQQAELAAKEPTFDFTVENKSIKLGWKNIENVQINYYLMDVELLFSRNPFVAQSGGQFSMIRPNLSKEMKLPAKDLQQVIPLPEELTKKNVLIEIVAAGKTKAVPYYANVMNVAMNENYGQLQVTDGGSGKMLSKVYVKTYVRLADGSVKFHKDGYTDHRGKFDYATVSTPEKMPITKFSILVLSETQGALIREVLPPQR